MTQKKNNVFFTKQQRMQNCMKFKKGKKKIINVSCGDTEIRESGAGRRICKRMERRRGKTCGVGEQDKVQRAGLQKSGIGRKIKKGQKSQGSKKIQDNI